MVDALRSLAVNRRAAIATTALLAAAALLGSFVASRLERVEVEMPIPPGEAAREDPLLAAKMFLSRSGFPATGATRVTPLPATRDALIVTGGDMEMTGEEVREIATWVASGGHAIVDARSPGVDPLLSAFSIRPSRGSEPLPTQEPGPAARVQLRNPDESLRVRTRGPRLLPERRPGAGAGDAREAGVLLRVPLGRGDLVAVADLAFIENDRIGDLDHARLLLRLARDAGSPHRIVLVRTATRATFASILWRRGGPILIAIAALGALSLWRLGARFGPIVPSPEPGSRSLMEHVDAVGRFLWRRRREDVLFDAARAELEREIGRKRPDLAALPATARSRALAAHAGAAGRREILAALTGAAPADPEAFTRAMRALQSSRRSL
ncbi:MAG: hypothetical protein HY049_05635 [Acidobacteria bacterium]|nr:hypothetical protein [Acidobacteriota bacterium]